MINILLRRIVIRRNLKQKINLIDNDFHFFIDIIEEILRNEFINNLINKNKKYLTDIRLKIMKAKKSKELNESK